MGFETQMSNEPEGKPILIKRKMRVIGEWLSCSALVQAIRVGLPIRLIDSVLQFFENGLDLDLLRALRVFYEGSDWRFFALPRIGIAAGRSCLPLTQKFVFEYPVTPWDLRARRGCLGMHWRNSVNEKLKPTIRVFAPVLNRDACRYILLKGTIMTTILFLLAALFVLAVGTLVFQAFHAPEGREDAAGFHFASVAANLRPARESYTASSDHEAAAHVASQHLPAV